jgi:hypothetical protein
VLRCGRGVGRRLLRLLHAGRTPQAAPGGPWGACCAAPAPLGLAPRPPLPRNPAGLVLATAVKLASKRLLSLSDASRPHLRARCLLLVYKEDLADVLAAHPDLDKLRALM